MLLRAACTDVRNVQKLAFALPLREQLFGTVQRPLQRCGWRNPRSARGIRRPLVAAVQLSLGGLSFPWPSWPALQRAHPGGQTVTSSVDTMVSRESRPCHCSPPSPAPPSHLLVRHRDLALAVTGRLGSLPFAVLDCTSLRELQHRTQRPPCVSGAKRLGYRALRATHLDVLVEGLEGLTARRQFRQLGHALKHIHLRLTGQ